MTIKSLTITNEGTDDSPSWTLETGDGDYLADNESLERLVREAKEVADIHGIDVVTLNLGIE